MYAIRSYYGADFDMIPRALDRAASLIVETAGGAVAPELRRDVRVVEVGQALPRMGVGEESYNFV